MSSEFHDDTEFDFGVRQAALEFVMRQTNRLPLSDLDWRQLKTVEKYLMSGDVPKPKKAPALDQEAQANDAGY